MRANTIIGAIALLMFAFIISITGCASHKGCGYKITSSKSLSASQIDSVRILLIGYVTDTVKNEKQKACKHYVVKSTLAWCPDDKCNLKTCMECGYSWY